MRRHKVEELKWRGCQIKAIYKLTLAQRHKRLFKKSTKVSTLCTNDVVVVVFSPRN